MLSFEFFNLFIRLEVYSFNHLIFESFNDAPGGFSEELKEITWATGVEYFFKIHLPCEQGILTKV